MGYVYLLTTTSGLLDRLVRSSQRIQERHKVPVPEQLGARPPSPPVVAGNQSLQVVIERPQAMPLQQHQSVVEAQCEGKVALHWTAVGAGETGRGVLAERIAGLEDEELGE